MFTTTRSLLRDGTVLQTFAHLYLNRLLYPSSKIRARNLIQICKSKKRLVFVCHGNICRSPYAEYKAKQQGLHSVSFGLACRNGDIANGTAQKVALERSIDLSQHKSQRFDINLIMPDDLVLFMEPAQLRNVVSQIRTESSDAGLLGTAIPRSPLNYLPDPYGLNEKFFRMVFSKIDSAVEELATLMPHAVIEE